MFDDVINTARATLDAPHPATVDHFLDLLRLGDRLHAAAASVAQQLASDGTIERTTGLPAESVIRLGARRTKWDAADVMVAADVLGSMPKLAEALARGIVSWSQTRSIVREVKDLSSEARAAMDDAIGAQAASLSDAEPDELVWRVEDEVAQQRADRAVEREDRQIARGFLAIQPRLGGGGSLYGEADSESFATIVEALDAAAARPDADTSRARQRMDALVAVCEAHLAGGASGTRPRPRFLATVDLRELQSMEMTGGARALASMAGRPLKLSPLATEVLRCDADVTVVGFDGPQPVAIANTSATTPPRLRAALIARDGGCRFPTCNAPAAWTDAHHIVWRSDGGRDDPTNRVLLCRRCHSRVHRQRWKIVHRPDGTIEFRHRGKRYTSAPRARPPARE